jgi:hypothetical protein
MPTDPVVEPEPELSKLQRFTLWFSANRTLIGGLLLSIAAMLRTLDNHPIYAAGADAIDHTAQLILAGTGFVTMAAGLFKSDSFHKERKAVVEAQAAGTPIKRLGRRADDANEAFLLHACPGDKKMRTLKAGEVCQVCGFPIKTASPKE